MLDITSDLVHELHRSGRLHETGIALGPDGWECGAWADEAPDSPLVALTQDAIDTWAGDPDAEGGLSEEDIQAMLADHDYRIRDEYGDTTEPGEDTGWAVVTGTAHSDDLGEESSLVTAALPWRKAFWVDLDQATRVIDDEDTESEHAGSIWVTAGGIWLVRSGDGEWARLTLQTAAILVYEADEDDVRDDGPLLAQAARAARELADLMAYDIPQGDRRLGADVQAWRQREAAISHTHTAYAIGELVRHRVQPAVRDGRGGAAHTVRMAHDGNTTTAAEDLDMSRGTLLGLLK